MLSGFLGNTLALNLVVPLRSAPWKRKEGKGVHPDWAEGRLNLDEVLEVSAKSTVGSETKMSLQSLSELECMYACLGGGENLYLNLNQLLDTGCLWKEGKL